MAEGETGCGFRGSWVFFQWLPFLPAKVQVGEGWAVSVFYAFGNSSRIAKAEVGASQDDLVSSVRGVLWGVAGAEAICRPGCLWTPHAEGTLTV